MEAEDADYTRELINRYRAKDEDKRRLQSQRKEERTKHPKEEMDALSAARGRGMELLRQRLEHERAQQYLSKPPQVVRSPSKQPRSADQSWISAALQKRAWGYVDMANLQQPRPLLHPERELLRVLNLKPHALSDLNKLRLAQRTIRELLRRGTDRKDRIDNPAHKFDEIFFYLTKSRRLRLEVLQEDIETQIEELREQDHQASLAKKRAKEVAMRFVSAGQDALLARELHMALDAAPSTSGFVYLRRWSMPDSSAWYKVGITNDASRREAEQNVLPVAAETIACVDVGSMDRARVIEATIHQVLAVQRITDANNRELFHLTDQQASAVKAAIERLT